MSQAEGQFHKGNESLYQGKETILFVDDEVYLAEVGREMLEDYGYVVDTMTSPIQALERFEKDQDRYDLLITDYTMPKMTGDQLVERIHGLRPGLPVIMCTGTELPLEISQRIIVAKTLLKPFDMDELLKVVRQVLDSSTQG